MAAKNPSEFRCPVCRAEITRTGKHHIQGHTTTRYEWHPTADGDTFYPITEICRASGEPWRIAIKHNQPKAMA